LEARDKSPRGARNGNTALTTHAQAHIRSNVLPQEPTKAKSQKPWLTLTVHDTPKPHGWTLVLADLMDTISHGGGRGITITFESRAGALQFEAADIEPPARGGV
jgi:hypothetical protein